MKEISNGAKQSEKYEQLKDLRHNEINMKVDKEKYAEGRIGSLPRWLLVGGSTLLAVILITCIITQLVKVGFVSKDILYNGSLIMHGTREELKLTADTASYGAAEAEQGEVVSCYYNFPSQYASGQLMPPDIHPYLCTHINIGFAVVRNKEIKLEEYQYRVLTDIVKLKHKNPQLKILLSVGGSGGDHGFSDMVIDHSSRKTFIRSIKSIIRNYTLDGVDLDWEFPALHKSGLGGRERQHFSQLLREIRMEFIREKRDYILTLAAAAPQTIVDVSYDVALLNEYVDYVNIMTYDFHYYTKYTPFTGFNSPLYARPDEHMYLATLNINYTVNMYISKGLDRDKIVVGIPTYGHTFALVNVDNARIGSPASGFGTLSTSGFINYPDVCLFMKQFTSDVTVMHDDAAKVPYLYRDKDWVSYDDTQSVTDKANFIKENRLRGAMIYSLNADDFEGVCATETSAGGSVKFPLLRSVKNTLLIN